MDARELQDALANWRSEPGQLLFKLGFEPLGLVVPESGLTDFGIEPTDTLTLEVAARRAGFIVFRITMNGQLDPDAIRYVAASLYRHNPTRRALLIFETAADTRLVVASWGLGPGPFRLQKLWIDANAPRSFELDILAALTADGTTTASELALAHARALDREGITRRFFAEFRRCRANLATCIVGVPTAEEGDRLDLSLILLSRLLFLYFIQRKGWLAGDATFLRNLYEASVDDGIPYYRRRLKPLFFGALNRPPGVRSRAARQLGDLPYLNGGLFERSPLERKYSRIDVPNDAFAPVFHGLLDKYQFTLREDQPADQSVAVDPEMLGKVFEGLMAGPARSTTGAFFTPRSLVDRLVDGALSAHLAQAAECDIGLVEELLAGHAPEMEPDLQERLVERVRAIRVLDPATGSGAFLLAALQRLETLRDGLEGRPAEGLGRFERRQQIIRHNLHGVDVNAAAVRLCELRLWLALVVDLEVDSVSDVPPLPNLDINIRQGDALVDPIDFLIQLADLDHGSLASRWKRMMKRLIQRRDRYFRASGTGKRRVQRTLYRAERELAIEFLGELGIQIDSRRDELRTAARSRDLFGRRSGLSRSQKRTANNLKRRKRELSKLLQRVRQDEELPFFSFPVHFADSLRPGAGFDTIIGNPPWVRTHYWSGLSRARLRERFRFLRDAGWRIGSRMAGAGRGFGAQLDLSALFLERSLELLAEHGTLGFLLPAKLARSLSAAALRRRLLASTRILRLEDHSHARNRLFDATTYPLSLLVSRGEPTRNHRVSVVVHDRKGGHLDFLLPQRSLPLLANDPESPWVLAPTPVRITLERMRCAGPALGDRPASRPRRGIFTGANAVFIGRPSDEAQRNGCQFVDLGGTSYEIEVERLRPVLHGENLAPWRFELSSVVVWTHDCEGRPLPKLPPATARYLGRHRRALESRIDLKPGQPYWSLFRVSPEVSAHRVAWRDIAPAPCAAVLPARARFLGRQMPVVSLNTVYQIPARSEAHAHLLTGVLNSTVARAYLKAIAERAAGGYFRFLGWTVALFPFPEKSDAAIRKAIVAFSRKAHEQRGLKPADRRRLDELVARLYSLNQSDLKRLRQFDARMTNVGKTA